jgi:hypothetical protein
MAAILPIFLPLISNWTWVETPYSRTVAMGTNEIHDWNMGGVGATISKDGSFDYSIALWDDQVINSQRVTNNQGFNSNQSATMWNNLIVLVNGIYTKGINWDYIFTLQIPNSTVFATRGQVNLSLGQFPNDTGSICFAEGGISCTTTAGQPLNWYDRIRGKSFWGSSAGCPSSSNWGGTCLAPLSKFASFSSVGGQGVPAGINPYVNDPQDTYLFGQNNSAFDGNNLVFTADVNETNNIISAWIIGVDLQNRGSCAPFDQGGNSCRFVKRLLWQFNLGVTPYANTFGVPLRITPTNRIGTVLVMTSNGTECFLLIVQLPGPFVLPIRYGNAGSHSTFHPILLDNGHIVMRNDFSNPNSFIASVQQTALGINLRLPSYADPMYVNGTDTITIL